ncbi:MAG: LysM peptidoglycan-binding domain-containing protein [Chloroflexi bacterium CFX4]|nr:LysM peptidoglycan-binding domain-containing protein [Chloroflexi bacterium CFX4]MDL1921779.1 LysM peptidoglycan-binding domain-containing protein [Chloroflexi bacterium CFX3]
MRRFGRVAALISALGILLWLVIGIAVLRDLTLEGSGAPTPTLARLTAVALRGTPTPIPLVSAPTETPPPPPTHTPTATTQPSATPHYIIVTTTPYPEVASAADLPPTAADAPESNATAACAPPNGWVAYSVQPGDTLFGFVLGADGAVDVQTLRQANCLTSDLLQVGQVLFLPSGAGEKAPKLDDLSGDVDALTRPSNCPCQITIRAGSRLEQIAERLDRLPVGFRGRDFLTATNATARTPDYWFLRSKPADKSLEGYMYPGSYTIEPNMTATQFRDMLLAAFAANVPEAYEGMAAARGWTFWQALNFASIVQRESWDANEQRMIAGVFHNRMADNRAIASSVTMMYALGSAGQWWYPAGRINFNLSNPYNTNRFRGLPPTPISSPAVSAIAAALDPVAHDYFFFNTRCGGGGNFYARTFEEFKAGLNCP